MALLLITAAFCCIIVVLAFPNIDGPGQCPGGYREGEQATLGSFYYECRNGQLVPKGCLSPSGRTDLGQSFDAKSIRWQCVVNAQGNPSLAHKSCIDNGQERQANERWDNGQVVYECKRDGGYVSIEAVGCIGDGGRKLNLGEKVTVGDLVYVCKLNRNAVPVYKPWGCAGKDSRQYATGDEYVFEDQWFYCMEKPDGRITADHIGCVHNGAKLRDGDRVYKNDVIFQCFVADNTAQLKVVGCVTQNVANGAKIDRRVGCAWQEGDEPFQYTLRCKPDEATKSAVKTAENCDYSLPQGTYKIEIGCYRVIDKVGLACMKGATVGDVKFVPLPIDENGQIISPPPGMRYC